jgi:cytidyltransferase-like protein
MSQVVVTGAFNALDARSIRFLEEASRFGDLNVLLWSDKTVRAICGTDPKFPQQERAYMLQAIRYVSRVSIEEAHCGDSVPRVEQVAPEMWVVEEGADNASKRAFCARHGMEYRVLAAADLTGFPHEHDIAEDETRRRVIVTGCFDWFHSGHVRFFEEVSGLGNLYVAAGNDANVRQLKGEGHPLFPQEERRYVIQSVRYVTRALITSGSGWLDAEPEIQRYRPGVYAVNEDGDRPEKRAFCAQQGIDYVVLRRTPREGLQQRSSTELRGF